LRERKFFSGENCINRLIRSTITISNTTRDCYTGYYIMLDEEKNNK